MASSRIFVKGLPSTITETEFRNHFGVSGRQITDVKIIPSRRIAYVGYKTPDEAASAVKYFNRTFIRMSKLAVEIARPIGDASLRKTAWASETPATVSSPTKAATTKAAVEQDEDANLKKRKREVDESDPMLREYLQIMQPSSKRTAGIDVDLIPETDVQPQVRFEAGESDDEYEEIPSKRQSSKLQSAVAPQPKETQTQPPKAPEGAGEDIDMKEPNRSLEESAKPALPAPPKDTTDDEWLRSRTNRLLDLLDDDEPLPPPRTLQQPEERIEQPDTKMDDVHEEENSVPAPAEDVESESQDATAVASAQEPKDSNVDFETIRKTSRLFVRNLPYSTSEGDLRIYFEKFGTVREAHLPVNLSGRSKGYALVLYDDASSAIDAFQASDGIPFQGRILHIVPAAAKRDNGLDEFAISKLPLKKQNLIRKRAGAASNTFNWNSLFMNQDAVNASIADRLGISKAELLDPTSADAGVKQAIAETTVIQETKAYFAAHGVDLNAFKSNKRGETAILVKNFPFGTSIEELRNIFEEHGTVLQVLMPPSGTIAIIQFAQPDHAKAAFVNLAYRRIRDSILFLEKAPKDIFVTAPATLAEGSVPIKEKPGGVQKLSVTELLGRGDTQEVDEPTTSLYVRNLNFTTTTDELANAFTSLDGFVSARVKTKTDPKKPGQILSMGFGFVEFRTKPQALAAIKAMDGFVLAGHTLAVKASHRGLDAAEERRREDAAKKAANMRTKIVIKNLPFEATKKDVRALFSTYGELRAVRVPKKFNHQSRGFAFAEFVTPREAENAVSALKDTHLLGRKLVIDFAEAETIDPEEEIARMQRKVGGQVNKVAMQQLTNRGRTKVNIGNTEDDMEM